MPRESKAHRRRRLWALKGWRTRRANMAARARRLAIARRRRKTIKRVGAIVVRSRRPARARKRPSRNRETTNRRAGRLKSTARSASVIARETAKAARAVRRRTAPNVVSIAAGKKGADPLQIQVSAKFRLPAGMEPSAELTKQAILFRIEHGYDAPGATTAIVRWRNPGRRDPKLRAWREGDQDAAFATLANALRAWCEV